MDLGEVDALRRGLRHLVGPDGSNSCCQERGEIVSFPKAQGTCSLSYARQTHIGFFAREDDGRRAVGDRGTIV